MKKLIYFFIFSLFFAVSAKAQTISATVNRTKVPVGETFILSLGVEGKASNTSPDFKVLEKDFQIVSSSKSFQTTFINGETARKNEWIIALIPLKTGTVTIPSLDFGNAKSNEIIIEVVEGMVDEQGQEKAKFGIEALVDNMNPYVQQQINLVVTIKDARGIMGGTPKFLTENDEEWIIRAIKQPTVDNKIVEGRNIQEIKFFYALFPQKSGKLKVPEFRFQGYSQSIINPTVVALAAPAVEVDVKPAAITKGWWIPSNKVELYAEWDSVEMPEFKTGDAINRMILLRAEGVLENQLPTLNLKDAVGIKQYPEKPVEETTIENDKLVSIKKIDTVYIPSKAGKTTLPEISVEWFNVNTGEMETAKIPAVEVDVKTAEGEETSNIVPAPLEKEIEVSAKTFEPLAEEQKADNMLYFYIFGAFILGICVAVILITPKSSAKKNSRKKVFEAAKAKDLPRLQEALVKWGQERFNDEHIYNLNDIAKAAKSSEFSKQADIIMANLYGHKQNDFDAAAFIDVFKMVERKNFNPKTSEQPLPKLYE